MRRTLSSYHPILYTLRVAQRRLFRSLSWRFSGRKYSRDIQPEQRLSHRYLKHTSKLISRRGESDIQLQYNKITNLKLVEKALDGIVIKPGEYFSFCYLIGKPSYKRGFIDGMQLSYGEARKGVGGGICQASNLIHWLALHSELKVIEKANHSFDPFPDEGRVLPFGSGAAIFYNYVDLVLYNPTPYDYQIRLHVAEHQLEGELLCSEAREYRYHIDEKSSSFIKKGEHVYRCNEIWRDIYTKSNVGAFPQLITSELLYENSVVVKYDISDEQLR
ncbi:VanW family protein [Klebsiella pneumoniae]|uniref:VanW family protein n=1 Tax=Klebsiella pneumoniae TaxID=573 RepID=UPI001F21100F|nr:VanW family protein [Klebsiella pneumoniae]MCF1868371.1 VanW family protein [Klebsiella pneumoniae]